jgi:hypothetical protein
MCKGGEAARVAHDPAIVRTDLLRQDWAATEDEAREFVREYPGEHGAGGLVREVTIYIMNAPMGGLGAGRRIDPRYSSRRLSATARVPAYSHEAGGFFPPG